VRGCGTSQQRVKGRSIKIDKNGFYPRYVFVLAPPPVALGDHYKDPATLRIELGEKPGTRGKRSVEDPRHPPLLI